MNRRYVTVARNILPITVAWLALPAAAAQLDASELARCAALAGSNERLACYDALAASVLPGATSALPAATPAPAASTPPVASVAPAAQTTPVAAAAVAGQAATASRAVNPDDPANFGLTRQQLKAIPSGPDSIKGIVSQMTEDRLNNVVVVLDNGQTWTFVEQEPRLRPGDSVTIKRASLGSFLMTTPSRHSYRVQRLK
jgi:hypothetical protein